LGQIFSNLFGFLQTSSKYLYTLQWPPCCHFLEIVFAHLCAFSGKGCDIFASNGCCFYKLRNVIQVCPGSSWPSVCITKSPWCCHIGHELLLGAMREWPYAGVACCALCGSGLQGHFTTRLRREWPFPRPLPPAILGCGISCLGVLFTLFCSA
jgi:hypothetical protein